MLATVTNITATDRLGWVLDVLRPVLDIVEGRVDSAEPPAWCAQRGWADFLLSLSDEALHGCEAQGLEACVDELHGVPSTLMALARAVSRVTSLPPIEHAAGDQLGDVRLVSVRKRAQLQALLAALEPMARGAERIVDVGAGRGAFTRLSRERFERPALGIERDENRSRFAAGRALGVGGLEFRVSDVLHDGLELQARDLAVGLHACGELGDRLAAAAAQVGCALALVPCCLQKIVAQRRAPLSRAMSGVSLSRSCLGLTNQTAQPEGVETSLASTQSARLIRYSLLQLLRGHGLALAPGEEMRGINRRRAHQGLREVALRAFSLRGLPPPSDAEIAHYEALGRSRFGSLRRLALPRSLLARLVELSVALDRAALLEEHGCATRVGTLFERRVTPRNLAIFASREEARLPSYAASS